MSLRAGRLLSALASMSLIGGGAAAQGAAGPSLVVHSALVPEPADRRFAGTLELEVDATDVAHKIFAIREIIPVQGGGTITLLYPRWEAASHGPSISVTDLAGLAVHGAGRPLVWRRDPFEPHAFQVDVPAEVRMLEVRFQMVAGGDLLTPNVVALPWQRLILYPAGWFVRDIPVAASVMLPDGLRPHTALDIDGSKGAMTRFATTTLERLLDSPVLAGRYTVQLSLTAPGPDAVSLDLVAVRPDDLVVPAERLAEMRRLVEQARKIFGPAPFRRYEFLTRLGDDAAAGGTEHRASSENDLASTYFRDWAGQLNNRDLIGHELVHSWNGLYRTPQDLWAPTPNVPVSGSLLWVYEGQTEFWGRVLAARSGQRTLAETRDRLAIDAAEMQARPGRAWRPLSDDVNYPAFMLRQPMQWRDWQRRRDYYDEGVLLWLAVDAELRRRTGGRRGIDDFAALFFADASPDAPTRTYTFDDLCRTLATLAPADWGAILRGWIDAHEELDPTEGLKAHGWRLVFTETPTATFQQSEEEDGVANLSYSIGLTVAKDGNVRSVAWDGPAFRAGMRPGVRILAVGDKKFEKGVLIEAVRNAHHIPVVLTVEQDDVQSSRLLPYRDGLRYPRLERIAGRPDTLAALLAPK
jgi:predicted metalloprotease with PDZ domain